MPTEIEENEARPQQAGMLPHKHADISRDDPCVNHGSLVFAAGENGKTDIIRAQAHSPLKILTPAQHGKGACAFLSTYGGGLVAGDYMRVNIHVQRNARAMISTQSATKVYRQVDGKGCGQDMNAELEPCAVFFVLPNPVMCFAHAKYTQRQVFKMPADHSAGLCLVDWLVSGRRARGEYWDLEEYISHNEIWLAEQRILYDNLRLSPRQGELKNPQRLGRYHCFATLIMIGEPMKKASSAILEELKHQPIQKRARMTAAASPLADGVILRLAGVDTQEVAREIRRWCAPAIELLGDDPWSRKW